MDFTLKERMSQTVVSFGFSFPGVFEFGFNYNSAKYSKSVKKLRRASGKVSLPPLTSSTSTNSQSQSSFTPPPVLQLRQGQGPAGTGPVHAEV